MKSRLTETKGHAFKISVYRIILRENCDEQKKNITVGMLDCGFDPFRLGVFFQSLVYVNAYLQSAFQNKLTYIYSKPENHR